MLTVIRYDFYATLGCSVRGSIYYLHAICNPAVRQTRRGLMIAKLCFTFRPPTSGDLTFEVVETLQSPVRTFW